MASPKGPLTRAERTNYAETSRAADVAAFLDALKPRSPWLRVESFGRTSEGRDMTLVILSSDRAFDPEAARRRGKPIVLIINNIHAGEVCGKEACQMIVRDVVDGPLRRFAEDLTLVIVPIFNVDGNERISPDNRKLDLTKLEGQMGPEGGVGTRHTAEGYDLNREYMNQSAIEMRNLTRNVYLRWWPDLTVDCHTTDGSIHGYHLTYGCPQNPSGARAPIEYVRTQLLPTVTRRLAERTRFQTFFYGNYRENHDPATGWETYPHLPRFGAHYRGLTGRMDVLSEAYSYIPFADRVAVTREFLVEVLDFARENASTILDITAKAEADTVARGARPATDDLVGLRYKVEPWPDPVQILAQASRPVSTLHYANFVPTLSVRRPAAYLIPPDLRSVVAKLTDHGARMERLARPHDLEVERYTVESLTSIKRNVYVQPSQRAETQLTVTSKAARVSYPAGTIVVSTAQPLGNLIVYLLEPQSDDGLVAWNYLDDQLTDGRAYPIDRLPSPADLATEPIKP